MKTFAQSRRLFYQMVGTIIFMTLMALTMSLLWGEVLDAEMPIGSKVMLSILFAIILVLQWKSVNHTVNQYRAGIKL